MRATPKQVTSGRGIIVAAIRITFASREDVSQALADSILMGMIEWAATAVNKGGIAGV